MGVDEQILVVPRAELMARGSFRGVSTSGLEDYEQRVQRHGFFKRRGDVEEDPSLKQIIPYMVVRQNGRVMLFQRTKQGGEGRLHGLFSIGVGGHVARGDAPSPGEAVREGMRRELEEELALAGAWSAHLVGVLNDDDNAVGQVHFGLVHIVDVPSGAVSIRETERLTGRLATVAEVHAAYDRMETWSQLVVDAGIVEDAVAAPTP
jgi:predicted NUDIX family phosphoesterase